MFIFVIFLLKQECVQRLKHQTDRREEEIDKGGYYSAFYFIFLDIV